MASVLLYDTVLRRGAVSASVAGSAWRSAVDWRTTTYWALPDTSVHWIASSLAATVTVDSIAIYRHNGGSKGLQVWAEVYDDLSGWIEIDDSRIEYVNDNQCVLHRFAPVSAQQLRLCLQAADTDCFIGVAMLGQSLTLPYGMPAGFTPPRYAQQLDRIVNESDGGQYIGSGVIKRGARVELRQPVVSSAWLRTHGEPLIRHIERLPMVWMWSDEYPQDTCFCYLPSGDQVPEPKYRERGWHDFAIPLQCLLSD